MDHMGPHDDANVPLDKDVVHQDPEGQPVNKAVHAKGISEIVNIVAGTVDETSPENCIEKGWLFGVIGQDFSGKAGRRSRISLEHTESLVSSP